MPALHDQSGHAPRRRIVDRFNRRGAVAHDHVREGSHPAPDRRFETRAAHDDTAQVGVVADLPVAMQVPEEVAEHVATPGALGLEFTHDTREEVVHHAITAGEHPMRMRRLRHAPAQGRGVLERVPFDEEHVIE